LPVVESALAYLIPSAFGFAIYLRSTKEPNKIEALAISWGIGWATVNILFVLLNQHASVLLTRDVFSVASAGLGVGTFVILFPLRSKIYALLRETRWPSEFWHGLGLSSVLLLGMFGSLIIYKGLTIPPTSTDAIVYHMRLPKLAWETGILETSPGVGWLDLVTALPNLLVTQQLWIYLGANEFNEVLVRPILPVYSLLLLVLVYSDARRWFGTSTALLAASGLFSLNEFASLTITIWAEIPVAFYAYLAVRSLLDSTGGVAPLVKTGSFAGMASLVKYNGLVVALALAFIPLVLYLLPERTVPWGRKIRGLSRPLASLAVIGLSASLVAAPILVRNLLIFGNPIYPFLFGGQNTEQIAYFNEQFTPIEQSRFRLFEIIVLAGTLLTAGVAVGLLRLRRWSRSEKTLALSLLLYLPIYLYAPLAGSHIRYMAPVIPALSVLAARQLSWWLSEADLRGRLSGAVAFSMVLVLVLVVFAALDVRPEYFVRYTQWFAASAALVLLILLIRTLQERAVVLKLAVLSVALVLLTPGMLAVAAERFPPRETVWDISLLPPESGAYLESRFGDDWRMWQWINTNLPTEALILTFEPRLLYLERDVLFGSDHELIPTYSMALAESVAFVRGLGVDYILDSPWSHTPGINYIFWTRSIIFQSLGNATYFRPVHSEAEVRLYALA